MSATTNDQCEHCHSTYTFIKKKKACDICHQSYCANCAPRERYLNQSIRICVICQLIANDTTTDEQLLELKVKQLKNYLQAKNIPNQTCTEKRELVHLIKQNRHVPFVHLSSATNNTSQQQQQQQSQTTVQPPKSDNQPKPFANLQHTVSSFANQMNNLVTNIQDYVANTVSDVMSQTAGDEPPHPSPRNNPSGATSFHVGSATNGASTHSFSSAGSSTHTMNNSATTNSQQPRRPPPPPPPPSTATASSTSNKPQPKRRKSLSEINNEENIEDLNIRDLKEILAANFVDFKGCVEKNELIEKVRRLYRDRLNEQMKAKELDGSTAGDNELCKICMDAITDCVFLDCGHMVTCVKCGKLLAECPICRSNIVRVVRVFKS